MDHSLRDLNSEILVCQKLKRCAKFHSTSLLTDQLIALQKWSRKSHFTKCTTEKETKNYHGCLQYDKNNLQFSPT